MWTRFYNRYGDLNQRDNFERCLSTMLRHKPMQVLQPNPSRIRREFWQGPPTYTRLFALFHEHYAERLGKPRWGDQLGSIERYANPIFAAFPTAKMIHMIRDPRERLEESKNRSRSRQGKTGWNTARWLDSVSLSKRNQYQYPNDYKVVRYETLYSQPEQTLKEICAFIGEDFVPDIGAMKDATEFEAIKGTGANHNPDLGRGTPASNNGFHKGITKREIAFTQAYAGREMLAFNYPLEPIQFSLHDRLLFYFVDWPANRAGMVAWNMAKSRQ